jgi:hypothetical protein
MMEHLAGKEWQNIQEWKASPSMLENKSKKNIG